MIGGATVIGIGSKHHYVTPGMAAVGDHIIITKGAAIEAAGLFAVTFPQQIAEAYDQKTADEAEKVFWQMSVVEDALTAVQVGVRDKGVTSMHDATECGIWGGLSEVAEASGVGLMVDKEKIILQDVIQKVCEYYHIDPFTSISEGTLIITVKPHKSKEVIDRLQDKNIPASIVGEIVPAEKGMIYHDKGVAHELVHPKVDPFWSAFGKAASQSAG
jgi:hydrogenase maturation factor